LLGRAAAFRRQQLTGTPFANHHGRVEGDDKIDTATTFGGFFMPVLSLAPLLALGLGVGIIGLIVIVIIIILVLRVL
jgi:hypothetical protein